MSGERVKLFSGELIYEGRSGNPYHVRLSKWFSSLSAGGRKRKVSSSLRSFKYDEVVLVSVLK